MTRCRLVFAVSLLPLAGLLAALVILPDRSTPESVLEIRPEVDKTSRHELSSMPRVAICFAPDTPDEVIQTYYEAMQDFDETIASPFRLHPGGRWTTTATNGSGLTQGDPTTITWSIIPDGTPLAGGSVLGESSDPSDLRAFLDGIYGSEADWLPLFEQIFDRWGALTGTTYVYEPNDDGAAYPATGVLGVRGDVRIGGHRLDGTSNVLAYNAFPIFGGDMVIDTDDGFYNNTANNSRGFRNVLAHEHGHGLGFLHVCPICAESVDPLATCKLMEPFVNTSYDGPQHDDILAAHRSYGDRLEPNDSFLAATDIGGLGDVEITLADFGLDVNAQEFLSIDDDGDSDWFAAGMPANQFINVTVTPIGETYLEGPQNSNGSCSAGGPFDSLTVADLVIEVIAPDGVTRLLTQNAAPAGEPETVVDFELLAGPGVYFIRVSNNGNNSAQMYDFQLAGAVNDMEAPVVTSVFPAQNTQLAALPEIQVTFNKPVREIDPSDLLINGSPATSAAVSGVPTSSLVGSSVGPFSFLGFDVPSSGQVQVELLAGSLTDAFGNTFEGDSWSLVVADCNENGFLDAEDIITNVSEDCNGNGMPDECETDFVQADAGPDQTVSTGDVVTVGGNPPAFNGIAPYTYEWTLRGNPGGQTDTNPNPSYGALPAGVYVARLVVTDATGCTATDFVMVTVEGDDGVVPLPPVGGDCAPAAMSSSLTLMAMIAGSLTLRRRRRR